MHRFRLTYGLCIVALLLSAPVGRADDHDEAAKKLGQTLIDHLPEIKPGATREACMETRFDGKVVGYTITTLRGARRQKDLCYEYSDTSVIRGPNGETRELRTSAILDRRFQPETVTWEISSRAPNGVEAMTKETLAVDDKALSFKRGDAGNMTTNSIVRPKEPFVHMAGILFGLLPLKDGMEFRLQEFDSEKQEFIWTTYRVRKEKDGGLRTSVMDDKGAAETAYYLVNDKGEIEEHGVAATPFKFKRCTRQRIEEIKLGWDKAAPKSTPKKKKKP